MKSTPNNISGNTMNNNKFLVFPFLALLIVNGCGGMATKETDWTTVQKNEIVVWSDDSSELAVVVSNHEERYHEGQLEKRNIKHQIFAQHLDGSHRRAISELREHHVKSLYYMKQAGYLIVEVITDTGLRRFDRMALNGDSMPIFEETQAEAYRPCQSNGTGENTSSLAQVEHSLIPSPNGSQLAHIYSLECGKVTVQFEHALSSDYIDSQTIEINQAVTPMWYPEGYVILAGKDGSTALKVAVQETAQLTRYPHCTFPQTISSNVSLQGQKVYFEDEKIVTEIVGIEKSFGCQ